MDKRHSLDALTGLKGIVIYLIVLFHTLPDTPIINAIPLTSFIRLYGGTLGNYIFFMLSGFLMTCGYKERIRSGGISFGAFLGRRLRKLYPLYILSNVAALVIGIVEYGWSAVNLKNIAFTLLLQNGAGLENAAPYNGPTWFLSALFLCYIVFFAVAYHAKNQTQYYCMIAACVALGYTLTVKRWEIPFFYMQTGSGYLNFFLGCALAELWPRLDRTLSKKLVPAGIMLLAGSGILLLRYGVEIISGDSGTAFAFWICPLILYVSLEEGVISRILQSRSVRFLGRISMSVYFWHYVIYDLFEFLHGELAPGKAILDGDYVLYLAVMIGLCILSSKTLERLRSAAAEQAVGK